jgi:hypothetical protein
MIKFMDTREITLEVSMLVTQESVDETGMTLGELNELRTSHGDSALTIGQVLTETITIGGVPLGTEDEEVIKVVSLNMGIDEENIKVVGQ